MNNPPVTPTDSDVLAAMQTSWPLGIESVSYVPVGFGAHHWQGTRQGAPVAFITLDISSDERRIEELERAYSAAAELADLGFEAIVSPVRNLEGRYTARVSNGLLSVTPWINGKTPTPAEAAEPVHVKQTIQALHTLHKIQVPESLLRWEPQFKDGFVEQLARSTRVPWEQGPLGESSRDSIRSSLVQLHAVASRFTALADRAQQGVESWVPTHGEPHFANQILSEGRLYFVDWESFRLAPPERDIVGIPPSGWRSFHPDPEMIELFRLEWTLSEIDAYASWFSEPHSGNQDDQLALSKLQEELNRNYS